MKTYLCLMTQLVFALSVFVASGQGTFVYDQSSATNRSFAGGYEFQQEQPFGQSFTPSLASIGFVQMEFIGGPQQLGGATVYVNLRADSVSPGSGVNSRLSCQKRPKMEVRDQMSCSSR